MSQLDKGLGEWVAQGLISQKQADHIRAYESRKPENSWILSGLLILGAVIVGIGIISIIAANWERIPAEVKLVTNFLCLSCTAFAIVTCRNRKKHFLVEALLSLFLVLCLASIGLISQIFHTGGHLYQALMFWSVITLGVAMAAEQLFVPLLWTGVFLASFVLTSLDSPQLQLIYNKQYPAVFMAVPLLCLTLTAISRWMGGDRSSTRAFRVWTLLSLILAIAVAEVHEFAHSTVIRLYPAYIPAYTLTVFCACVIQLTTEYNKIQKLLLQCGLLIYFILFHLPLLEIKSSIIYAGLSISLLGIVSIFLASIKSRRVFQCILFLMGVRFLLLYFKAVGGLALTGFGLILSGIFVIFLTMLWSKYRKEATDWAERLVS